MQTGQWLRLLQIVPVQNAGSSSSPSTSLWKAAHHAVRLHNINRSGKDLAKRDHLGSDPRGDVVAEIDWLSLFDKMGIPVAALVAIGYGIFSTCKWLGNNILMPLHQRHLLFLDRLEAGIQKICDKQVEHNSQILDLATKIGHLKED